MAADRKKRGPGAPKIGDEPLVRKSVGLPPTYWEKLEKLAAAEGRKLSAVVRDAVAEYLRRKGK